MPSRPVPTCLVARVRDWFGLTQAELALYLGISPPLVRDLETERRALTPAVRAALLPLLLQLPLPGTTAPPETPAALGAPLPSGTPAPDAADLGFRRRECLYGAARLLERADALAAPAHLAGRWAAARPALLPNEAGTGPDPAADPDTPAAQALAAALAQAADPTDPARARDHARWLRGWLAARAQPPSPAEVTRYHRLRARAAGLLAEAAALAEALDPPPAAGK